MTGNNHTLDCPCGWCSGGYRGSSEAAPYWNLVGREWCSDKPPKLASYIDANAVCPYCKCRVYFYRSPNGGAVFFDSLGPPWPKHPCTNKYNLEENKPKIEKPGQSSYFFEKKSINGWSPLVYKKIDRDSNTDRILTRIIHPGWRM